MARGLPVGGQPRGLGAGLAAEHPGGLHADLVVEDDALHEDEDAGGGVEEDEDVLRPAAQAGEVAQGPRDAQQVAQEEEVSQPALDLLEGVVAATLGDLEVIFGTCVFLQISLCTILLTQV